MLRVPLCQQNLSKVEKQSCYINQVDRQRDEDEIEDPEEQDDEESTTKIGDEESNPSNLARAVLARTALEEE